MTHEREPPEWDLPVDPDSLAEPDTSAVREPIPWDVVAAIAAGGAVGGLARHSLNVLVAAAAPQAAYPWSTYLENVVGSFLLAVFVVLIVDVWPPRRYLRPFLVVGVLGGFTTFSTFANDGVRLLEAGEGLLAGLYLVGTVLTCLLATWVGLVIARRRVATLRSAGPDGRG